jgi:hypothetical protein
VGLRLAAAPGRSFSERRARLRACLLRLLMLEVVFHCPPRQTLRLPFDLLHPPLRSQLDIITNTLFSHHRADTFSHIKISIAPYLISKSQTEFAS